MITIAQARAALRKSPHADVLLDKDDNLTTTDRGDAEYILCGVTRDNQLITECLEPER